MQGNSNTVELRNATKRMLKTGEGLLEERLIRASRYGFLATVQQLIREGASVNCGYDGDVLAPLSLACFGGHLSCVHALLEAGADVNWCNSSGCSALFSATSGGNTEIVKLLLLQPGINVNIRVFKDLCTSLICATLQGFSEVVGALLAHPGIDVNAKSEDGIFALYQACYGNGNVEIFLMLMAHPGIDVNLSTALSNDEGYTCFFKASEGGHTEIVAALLANPKIDLNVPGNAECLCIASESGHHEVAQLLLSHPDVDINHPNRLNGLTALGSACRNGHVKVVRVLLSTPGIDVNKKCQIGTSPLYWALSSKNTEIIALLEGAGAHL